MNKIFKLVSILILTLMLYQPNIILADEASSSAKPTNSFELFWPLTAGKTRADGVSYQLKKIKENLRAFFIFKAETKADYRVFLATKRLLEAEKLWQEKNNSESAQAIKESRNDISQAKSSLEQVKNLSNDGKMNISNQLNNIIVFTNWNLDKQDIDKTVQDELRQLNKETSELINKL